MVDLIKQWFEKQVSRYEFMNTMSPLCTWNSITNTKGQLISKCPFGVKNSSKKVLTPKGHFEINWPLENMNFTDIESQGADRMDKKYFHVLWMDTIGQEVMITKEAWQPELSR